MHKVKFVKIYTVNPYLLLNNLEYNQKIYTIKLTTIYYLLILIIMKAFYIIFLFIFLTSCGANTATQVINETTDTPVNVEQDVPTETEEVSDSEPDPEVEAPSEEPPVIPTSVEWEVEAPSEEPPVVEANVEWKIEAPSEEPPVIPAVDDTTSDIDDAVEQIETQDESADSSETSLIELSTSYTNPAMEAVMNIAIEVDSDNIIESISITSPNYKWMPKFNDGVQGLVGKSLEEASEFYVSGSSLASPAFQKALKKAL